MTGDESYFTAYKGYDIMFHVAPMLPFDEDDEQQVFKVFVLILVKT